MKILKRRDFRDLMIGKAISMIGSNVQQFALSLYVLSTTQSATLFASMLAISILPRILLSPVAGVFGDWFDRKKTIVRLDVINGLLIGSYALYFYVNDGLSLWSVYLLVILLEIIEVFFGSAMGAVIPSMVNKEDLIEANRSRSMIMSLANMMAPVLASAIYGMFGLFVVLVMNALSFLVSAFFENRIEIPAFHKQPAKIDVGSFKADFLDGLRVLRSHRVLTNIIGLGIFLNFSLSPLFSVGIVVIVMDVLKASEFELGLIMTISAVAMFVGPLLLGKKVQRIPMGQLLIMAFFTVGILIVLMSVVSLNATIQYIGYTQVIVAMIALLMFLVALLTTVANIAVGTLFDTLVPKEYFGRVGSVMNMSLMATIPLGQILFGISIDRISAPITILVVGIITLLATLYFKNIFIEKEKSHDIQVLSS